MIVRLKDCEIVILFGIFCLIVNYLIVAACHDIEHFSKLSRAACSILQYIPGGFQHCRRGRMVNIANVHGSIITAQHCFIYPDGLPFTVNCKL